MSKRESKFQQVLIPLQGQVPVLQPPYGPCYFLGRLCYTDPLTMPERDQFLGQVERLCESDVLHGSESLCRLLRYLALK